MAELQSAPATDTPRGLSLADAAAQMDSRMASGFYTNPNRAQAAPGAPGSHDQPDTPDDAKSPSAPPHSPVPGEADPDAQSDDMNTHSRPDTPAPDEDTGEDDGEQPEEEKPEAEEETAEGDYIEDEEGNRIPVAEALNTYKRFRDLQARVTRKEQALAEERRAVEGHVREIEHHLAHRARQLEENERTYLQRAGQVDAFLQEASSGLAHADQQWAQVDWARLKEEAPGDFLLRREEYRQHLETKQQVDAHRQRLAWERQQFEQRRHAEAMARLQQHIGSRYGEYVRDPVKGQQMSDAMVGLARELGYNERDIQETVDPRAWDLWHMAASYKLMMQQRDRAMQGPAKRQVEQGEHAPRRVKVVKANAPKPRAVSHERALLGGTNNAFKQAPTMENALRALDARSQYEQRAQRR